MDHFDAIRSQLSARGLDAVMLTEEFNRFYAADFPSMGTDGIALITKNANYYFTDSRYTVAAERAVKNAAITITGTGRGYVELVNEVIHREGLEKLGFDDAAMTVADHTRYCKSLDCELLPASAMMTELRTVKDEEEIRRLIQAQRISEKALAEVMNFIRPGVTEKEVAARLQYLMLLYGAEKMSFDPIVVAGENGAMPHGVPSDRPIQAGEFITMDFGCVSEGYCSDMTRTVAVGHVTDEMRTVYETVLRAQLTAIAITAAGKTGQEIDGAARKVIEDAGYGQYFGHGYGHGVGVEIHEAPGVSARCTTPLPAGAVTSAEPGIYLPGRFGVRIEDVVVLREGGCEDIALAPKELIIL
ncbi:MAG: aminopeptidase P family protein [Oscillospiraceae bacterium]